MTRYLVALAALLLAANAFAQPTCPAATTSPNAARDEARLTWVAPTQNTDGSAVGALTYKVYRSSGSGSTAFAVQCQTAAVSASLLTQPVGVQNYRVTALSGGQESVPSNLVTKTVAAPTPNPPANLSLLEQIVAFFKKLFGRFA